MTGRKIVLALVILVCSLVALLIPKKQKSPNVLLISLDTLRPNHLGCYGYSEINTPHIDAVSANGILFKDASTSVPLTLPSHCTILTGLCPLSHGVRDNGTFVLRDEFTTIAEMLKKHGYITGAFVGSFVIDARYGLNQGFDVYDGVSVDHEDFWRFDYPERKAEAVTDAAIRWLEKVKQPFFAFVHYFDPHTPYEPPPPYDSLYARSPYDGEIAYTDEEVGRLLDALEKRGMLENTLIVIVSDHGEGLGEHEELTHGTLIYQATIRVALIVKLPKNHRLTKKITKRVIEQPVGLVDVVPTILDLLGITFDQGLDGISLVPLMLGNQHAPRFFYMETMYPFFAYRWSPLRGIRFGNWKLIYAPNPELFDLSKDPGERENLFEIESERAKELKANIEAMVAQKQTRVDTSKPMSPAEERRLRTLGYISRSNVQVPVDIEPKGPDPNKMIVHAQKYLAEGLAAISRKDYDAAVQNLQIMLKIDPTNIEARMLFGRALLEMGRTDEALKEFLKATEMDSTYAPGFVQLAEISRQEGDLDKALVFLKAAAKLQPQMPGAFSSIAGILIDKGQFDEARKVLREALSLNVDDYGALNNMGLSFQKEGKFDSALVWFHKAIEVNRAAIRPLINVADIYLTMGKVDSVILYLERARGIQPRDVSILNNLGSAYRAKGMTQRASSVFEEAVKIEPNNYISLFGLAATRAEEGKISESAELLKKVLTINPDFEPARIALSKISQKLQH